MKTIAEHLDYIKSFFPEYFEDEADLGNVDTEETPNNDDCGNCRCSQKWNIQY